MVKDLELNKIIEKLKTHPKVVAIILFGSCAKGEQKPLSDIDIAVLLKEPTSKDEADVGSLYSEKIDLVLFHRLPLHIQYEVIKHGRDIFIRNADYFLDIKLKVLRNYLETNWLYRKRAERILEK